MKKILKYGVITLAVVIITIVGFIGFGLRSMEIEDQYGDYQMIYYKSKDGDIIVNEETSEFGIVSKNWKRLNIRTKENNSIDLYTFVSKVSYYANIKIYRPKTAIEEIAQMDFPDIQNLIEKEKIELILEHQNE